jgi:phenylalanyl-tRNA synthetase beta chain
MLCIEGIALNLNVFLNRQLLPDFRLSAPSGGELQTMFVEQSVCLHRLAPSQKQSSSLTSSSDRASSPVGIMLNLKKCQVQ